MRIYSPQVLDTLSECLRTIYWYKEDLKSFLVRCGVARERVGNLPWDLKRTAIKTLIDELAAQGPAGTQLLTALLGGVVEQDDRFPRLAALDDGKRKVEVARASVLALRDLLGKQTVTQRAETARREQRTEAQRVHAERQERSAAVAKLRDRFYDLATWTDEQRRGFEFQKWLHDLFLLHDLEPRGSFANRGEQIDGSIRVEGQRLLVEARWTAQMVDPEGVRDFVGKFEGKLDTTLGLMVSVSGFNPNAHTKATRGGRLLAIFMDGADLAPILEGLLDLRQLLARKLSHAAEKGNPMYRAGS